MRADLGGVHAPHQAFRVEGAASSFRNLAAPSFPVSNYLRRLVGVSAPAVPPITAPAPAPRPRPMMAPAAAPPAAPTPTFLARRRPPLRFLLDLWWWVVAAITGMAVSAKRPMAITAAHNDIFISWPSLVEGQFFGHNSDRSPTVIGPWDLHLPAGRVCTFTCGVALTHWRCLSKYRAHCCGCLLRKNWTLA